MKKGQVIVQNSLFSLGGQGCFLMANFLLMIILINNFSKEEFGVWALYITLISIADSIRQGLIQNGLVKFIIENPNHTRKWIGSGLFLNLITIGSVASILYFIGPVLGNLWHSKDLPELLSQAVFSLLGLGIFQFINSLLVAKEDYKGYLLSNILYALTFTSGVLLAKQLSHLNLDQIIRLQLLACIPVLIFSLIAKVLSLGVPSWMFMKRLFQFGRYNAGTNLMSLAFAKSDIFLIGFFLNPNSVAVYHLATKIINYTDLPLNAFSQVIYPRIAKAFHQHGYYKVSREYGKHILTLSLVMMPTALFIFLFKEIIINNLSSVTYNESIMIVGILLLPSLIKPWGRVFGLTLDAIGMPEVNFQMLTLSVLFNVIMNLILIPQFGLEGAAWATSMSTILTVVIGQLRIADILNIRHKAILREQWVLLNKKIKSFKHLYTWN